MHPIATDKIFNQNTLKNYDGTKIAETRERERKREMEGTLEIIWKTIK